MPESAAVTLAVVQMACSDNRQANIDQALQRVREAASHGAQIVLLQELFESLYFPQEEHATHFASAHDLEQSSFLEPFQQLAQELQLVLPISVFERAGQAYFNSLAMLDADGRRLGVYRKSHIPDGPGYEEKYYFSPGDSGFKVWRTRYGTIGVGICWDQWFPEAARAMALQGADLLLYPTAIGSEPAGGVTVDTRDMWQRAMLGHAVSNSCYLAAANRVGHEDAISFYGSSFICDYCGDKLAEADREQETILYAPLDFSEAQAFRSSFGLFRDRRPELYTALLGLDGRS